MALFCQPGTSIGPDLFLVSPPFRFHTFTAGTWKGRSEVPGKGWVRFRGGLAFSFLDRNERLRTRENFLLLALLVLSESVHVLLALSPSPTLFLKTSSDSSRFRAP